MAMLDCSFIYKLSVFLNNSRRRVIVQVHIREQQKWSKSVQDVYVEDHQHKVLRKNITVNSFNRDVKCIRNIQ